MITASPVAAIGVRIGAMPVRAGRTTPSPPAFHRPDELHRRSEVLDPRQSLEQALPGLAGMHESGGHERHPEQHLQHPQECVHLASRCRTTPSGTSHDGRMSDPATLHMATFADLDAYTLYALLRLRVDVFVVEQHCAYPEIDGRDTEPGALHVWLADEPTQPLGYLRILSDPGGVARIGRVAVARSARGSRTCPAAHARGPRPGR